MEVFKTKEKALPLGTADHSFSRFEHEASGHQRGGPSIGARLSLFPLPLSKDVSA